MKILSPSSYRVMPWKNGGGVTTELYVHPEDAGLTGGEFLWRVSIAEVARDGPFSRFDGYDRRIMLIEGHGMVLEGGPEGPIDVTAKYEPRHFLGDWDVAGRLCDGPVRDFNLLSRRRECRSTLRCTLIGGDTYFGSIDAMVLLYILEGSLHCGAGALPATYGLLLFPGDRALVIAADQPVFAAVCEIHPC